MKRRVHTYIVGTCACTAGAKNTLINFPNNVYLSTVAVIRVKQRKFKR